MIKILIKPSGNALPITIFNNISDLFLIGFGSK